MAVYIRSDIETGFIPFSKKKMLGRQCDRVSPERRKVVTVASDESVKRISASASYDDDDGGEAQFLAGKGETRGEEERSVRLVAFSASASKSALGDNGEARGEKEVEALGDGDGGGGGDDGGGARRCGRRWRRREAEVAARGESGDGGGGERGRGRDEGGGDAAEAARVLG
uniref:DUF834 domain-containing protein n=1 Tax=Oryza glaberrima TaxID=4538 RepID=I1PNH3_ORYGL